jgi:hypothetical protein
MARTLSRLRPALSEARHAAMPHRSIITIGQRFAPPKRPQRTIAVALLAVVLFNQPLLRVFDHGAKTTVFGLPVIYVYLFAAWALVIALMITIVELRDQSGGSNRKAEDSASGEPSRAPPTAGE